MGHLKDTPSRALARNLSLVSESFNVFCSVISIYDLKTLLNHMIYIPALFFFFFNIGYSFGTPQGDQFVAQGLPPPPATPGAGPLGFAPATTPSQDPSKAAPAQPDFSYSQYGKSTLNRGTKPLQMCCSPSQGFCFLFTQLNGHDDITYTRFHTDPQFIYPQSRHMRSVGVYPVVCVN